jgi:NAD(P)H-hydrate epimerase
MTAALPDTGDGSRRGRRRARRSTSCSPAASAVGAAGPGSARPRRRAAFVAAVVRRAAAPLVLDADGLNDRRRDRRSSPSARGRPSSRRIRARWRALVGGDVPSVQRTASARHARSRARRGPVVVLKGAHTVVAGARTARRDLADRQPGMASGGTGDVLAGVVGALLAQGLAPFDAATLGVFVARRRGDAVAARQGEVGLLARDILAELPATIARLQAAARPDVRPHEATVSVA